MTTTTAPYTRAIPGNLTVGQLVEQILRINASASRAFLESFTREQLYSYLGHLEFANLPRSRNACWTRPGDTPAVVCAEHTHDA